MSWALFTTGLTSSCFCTIVPNDPASHTSGPLDKDNVHATIKHGNTNEMSINRRHVILRSEGVISDAI
jgi:hypothetical protein